MVIGAAWCIARAIGNSLLVKSSWFGEDPNWGRLADAATLLDELVLSDVFADFLTVAGARFLERDPHSTG